MAEWRPILLRIIGRPRLRLEDYVREFLGKMKTQNWSKMAMDKEAWKRTAQQVKTQSCSAKRRRRKREEEEE